MMVARELILDPECAGVVHTTVTCPDLHNLVGLLEADAEAAGEPGDCPEALLAAADRHGLVIPTWAGRGLRPCTCCTLVADPVWAVAA
jgi:hypothetical protein